jgi:hypothetical protein
MPAAIQKTRALLVEGKDEVQFFDALLGQMALSSIQVVEVGGKDRLRNEFPALLNDPGFSSLAAYAIVRDADVSFPSALQSVCCLLKKHGEPCPRKHGEFSSAGGRRVGIYVMPGNFAEGMLETLCLRTVEDHPVMPCVNGFMDCLRQALRGDETRLPKNEAKARVQGFLAGMPEPVSSLGIGAQKGYWRLDHEVLGDLRRFLAELAK